MLEVKTRKDLITEAIRGMDRTNPCSECRKRAYCRKQCRAANNHLRNTVFVAMGTATDGVLSLIGKEGY